MLPRLPARRPALHSADPPAFREGTHRSHAALSSCGAGAGGQTAFCCQAWRWDAGALGHRGTGALAVPSVLAFQIVPLPPGTLGASRALGCGLHLAQTQGALLVLASRDRPLLGPLLRAPGAAGGTPGCTPGCTSDLPDSGCT